MLYILLKFVYTKYILYVREVIILYTTIQKWGNSHGIRIPKPLLEALQLRESDRVEIERYQDIITIRKACIRHKTLEERMANFEGSYEFSECDTGTPVGNEVW